jgi:hypothetical protein
VLQIIEGKRDEEYINKIHQDIEEQYKQWKH